MSNEIKLPGVELLGFAYDVQGYFADVRSVITREPLFTFNFSAYDPDNDPNSGVANIFGKNYYFPNNLSVHTIDSSKLTVQNTKSISDFELNIHASGEVNGWYEGFSGSLKASFGSQYRTNSAFYSIVQMGLIEGYRISLPSISALQSQLTPSARADINGDSGLTPTQVVNKYGTHFLFSGIFGGTLNYSQSISRYSVSREYDAEATVTANYLGFIGGSISSGFQTINNETSEQSNAVFEAKGGDPSKLTSGYQEWAKTVEDGLFSLVNFDPDALQPISVLADNPNRAAAIDEAIRQKLQATPPDIQYLRWDSGKKSSDNYGPSHSTPEDQMVLSSSNSTNKIIVGLAVEVKSSNVNRMALRLLDLDDNSLKWYTDDGRSYNASDYEVIMDIPTITGNRGVAMTGVALSCTDSNVSGIRAWYQLLDPADASQHPTFLDETLQTVYQGDSKHESKTLEVQYIPDPNAGKIIVGIGLGVKSDNFNILELWQAPLIHKEKSASVISKKVIEDLQTA